MSEHRERVAAIRANLEKVILGKPLAVYHLMIGLLAGGHVLMEDVPGVGKTTLARALALTVDGQFSRIQFTPDLLPADILGVSIYSAETQRFDFRKGPIFANILLADEINRASPRTQSALLQAMGEADATVDGETYALPNPFLVIATQNPVEYHGTYPLPEAQLDRFLLQTSLGYPSQEVEVDMLFDQAQTHPLETLTSRVTGAQVLELQKEVQAVKVERSVAQYIVSLVEASRHHSALAVGASPRGSISLFRSSRARAYLEGRDFALPDDVKAMAVATLAHRLSLNVKSRYAGVTSSQVVEELLRQTPVPA
ncbi:MAG: MoxR family ATPase [Candidatus Eremiobacteraeota bacterium]|nr:MoxR family ATPase [Candidatus Eremiobacteraeota bacterium]MCW5872821.1 MoxR family ATPase [Candidatus Eremiobacteraeota bacterium]